MSDIGPKGLGPWCGEWATGGPSVTYHPQRSWDPQCWEDVLYSSWLHRPKRFSIELLLRNTDPHCMWSFLDEILLPWLLKSLIKLHLLTRNKCFYCLLNRQYFYHYVFSLVLFLSALKAAPYITLTSTLVYLAWMPPGP